jgi:hypothetical protein
VSALPKVQCDERSKRKDTSTSPICERQGTGPYRVLIAMDETAGKVCGQACEVAGLAVTATWRAWGSGLHLGKSPANLISLVAANGLAGFENCF